MKIMKINDFIVFPKEISMMPFGNPIIGRIRKSAKDLDLKMNLWGVERKPLCLKVVNIPILSRETLRNSISPPFSRNIKYSGFSH